MDETILKIVKEVGIPMALVFGMLYYFVYKVFPSWQTREKEKDEFFSNQIKQVAERHEAQSKLYAQTNKDLADSFRAETEANRKQDDIVREHHKQVISDIANSHKTVVAEIYKANSIVQEQNERILKMNTDMMGGISKKLDDISNVLGNIITGGLVKLGLSGGNNSNPPTG